MSILLVSIFVAFTYSELYNVGKGERKEKPMEFGDVLRSLRKKRGLSQAKLAEELGMSKGLIGLYETGDRKPSFEALEELADYFNVTLDYLTGKDDKSVYYLDPDAAEMAKELYERPELRALFDASRKATKEDIEQVALLLERLTQ